MRRARAAGLAWPLPEGLDDAMDACLLPSGQDLPPRVLGPATINEVHPDWLPPSSFGYRVSIVFSDKTSSGATAHEDLVSDSYGFLVGQAEVELDATETSASGSAKPSSSLEQRLVHLLDSRANNFAG